jgi:hypothetical protein
MACGSDIAILEGGIMAIAVPWGPSYPLTLPIDGGFAWVNQGTATLDATKGGIHLAAPVVGAGNSWRLRVKAAPAPPYTVTAFIYPHTIGEAYAQMAIGWRQSSDGKLITFGPRSNFPSDISRISIEKYTDPTTFSANYLGETRVSYPTSWLRITDDGTDRKCYWSSNGQFWLLMHTVGRTDYLTADQVLFGVQANTFYPIAMTLLSWKES